MLSIKPQRYMCALFGEYDVNEVFKVGLYPQIAEKNENCHRNDYNITSWELLGVQSTPKRCSTIILLHPSSFSRL